MKIVVRVGGSVVGSPLNAQLITKYVELLKDLKHKGHQVLAVVGGGTLARKFIKVGEELSLEESNKDWIAIHVSRLFAQLFVLGLGTDSCGYVPVSIDEAVSCLETGKVVVLGGLHPGMTTDSVAALVSEHIMADLLVKGSNLDGIYNKDPKKFSDAKKLDRIKFEDLDKVFKNTSHHAGINQIIDPQAVKILQRSKLKTVIVDGYKLKNILAAVNGKRIGTIIE